MPQSPYSNQSYLSLPIQNDATNCLNAEDSSLSVLSFNTTSDSHKRSSHRKRYDLVLLGCASILASVGLGSDILELGRQRVLLDEHRVKDEKKKRDGLFQRTGRFRRSSSPPNSIVSKKDECALASLEPSTSVTLLSLSSISDCNSTKSLIHSDSDDINVCERPGVVEPSPDIPLGQFANPLVDLKVESFKTDPKQSLTPTHVTASRATASRGHRRTPSDGIIRQVVQTHRRTPSDGSMPIPKDTGCNETEVPHLPDPHVVFPPPFRRKLSEMDLVVERPKTLEFAPRPRPSANKLKLDRWKFVTFSKTQSVSPTSSCETPSSSTEEKLKVPALHIADQMDVRTTLLDMDMEGQNRDCTVALCGAGPSPPQRDTCYDVDTDVSY